MCQDKATASWAAEPIRIGPPIHTSMAVYPLLLGPDNLPAITDPEEAAQDIPLAVFSALTHAKDTALPVIPDALATALATTSDKTVAGRAEYTEIGLGESRARTLWSTNGPPPTAWKAVAGARRSVTGVRSRTHQGRTAQGRTT
ncbi:hypothetical protein AB0D57_20230 [Streptomyces sp. NPDC048275]|uniref:hypothetical protein n=1 Tax=Streptomyces sp. NPDC048275 TaxID=3155629 RepID=UPI0034018EC2